MQDRELTEMHDVEVGHWWYAGKRVLFRRLLGQRLRQPALRILDVGGGTGAVAVDLASAAPQAWICTADRSATAAAFARDRGVRHVVVADAGAIPFDSGCLDLVIAFDIIEHLDNDAGMLRDVARVLRPGGAVAIHVPAWPSLWSRHDEILEHKRRYTRRGLTELLDRAGFQVEYLGWASASIFLPAMVLRRVRRLLGAESEQQDEFSLPGPLNRLMLAVYRVESAIAASIGLPFGMSLAAIATPRDQGRSKTNIEPTRATGS